jgi:Zn-dependent peptidase ImmA (M78 family)
MDERFVDAAIQDLRVRSGCNNLPDLIRIARAQKVNSIVFKDIFSDGALEPVPGGFRVYLKSNKEYELAMTETEPALSNRTRFTLAHEIAHTFFYDISGIQSRSGQKRKPRTLKKKPPAKRLEDLCQYGAGSLLIPIQFLNKRRRENDGAFSGAEFVALAKELKVSPEALIRRLDQLEQFNPANSAQVLVELHPITRPKWRVVASRLGRWFRLKLGRPTRNSDLAVWLDQSSTTMDAVFRASEYYVQIGGHLLFCVSYPTDSDRHILDCWLKEP